MLNETVEKLSNRVTALEASNASSSSQIAELVEQLGEEIDRATTEENDLRTLIDAKGEMLANEITRSKGVDNDLTARVETLEGVDVKALVKAEVAEAIDTVLATEV